MSKRICQILDLQNEPSLIKAYKAYHQPGNVWPEVIQSIYDSGIEEMEIYLVENRLFMILEVSDEFSLDNKARMDAVNQKVQEWETLMQNNYQQALPWKSSKEWAPMERVFKLSDG